MISWSKKKAHYPILWLNPTFSNKRENTIVQFQVVFYSKLDQETSLCRTNLDLVEENCTILDYIRPYYTILDHFWLYRPSWKSWTILDKVWSKCISQINELNFHTGRPVILIIIWTIIFLDSLCLWITTTKIPKNMGSSSTTKDFPICVGGTLSTRVLLCVKSNILSLGFESS